MSEAAELGTPNLRLERDGPLAWCVIDRPHARNALTSAMYFGIRRALDLVQQSEDLHAVVYTGTGDVFAPGGEMGGRRDEGEDELSVMGADVLPFRPLMETEVPVVAAVNGICQGGGLTVAMLADVAVASERATFRAPELLRGVPDPFYAAIMPALIGVARTRELMMTGRRIDAEEALRIGLVARVVPHEQLRDAAAQAAHELLRAAPDARFQFKRWLNQHYEAIDEMSFRRALRGPEVREGFRAFVAKSEPAWVPEGSRTGQRL